VDSGSTHNFVHHHISQEINCYICVVNNFQIMIVNDSSMKCGDDVKMCDSKLVSIVEEKI
jgi:hypothetical protein